MIAGIVFKALILTMMIAAAILTIGGILMMLIDAPTYKVIGEEKVPCLDELNRPFEDELCEKKITCSWLGFIAEHRCSSDYARNIKGVRK